MRNSEGYPFDLIDNMWWRRRESNPRPEIFRTGFYILILNSRIRAFKSPPGWILEGLSCKKIRRSGNRT